MAETGRGGGGGGGGGGAAGAPGWAEAMARGQEDIAARVAALGAQVEALPRGEDAEPWRFVRVRVTRTRQPAADPCVQFEEVRLGGLELAAASCQEADSPWGEDVRHVLWPRGKFVDRGFRRRDGGTAVVLELAAPATGPAPPLSVRTANDFPSRDPAAWTVEVAAAAGGPWRGATEWVAYPPSARHEWYTASRADDAGAEDDEDDGGGGDAWLPPRLEARLDELAVVRRWAEARAVPAEYAAARASMAAVRRELLGASPAEAALRAVRAHGDAARAAGDARTFDELAHDAVARAYAGTPGAADSPWFQRCGLTRVPLMDAVVDGLHSALQWRAAYLADAVRVLAERDEPSGLVGVLSLLARGGRECYARKVMATDTAVRRAARLLGDGDAPTPLALEAERAGGPEARRAHEMLAEHAEDHKARAFRSALLEPAEAALELARRRTAAGDVEVHGSNVYGAAVLAVLGVRLPAMPCLHDEVKGACEFLDDGARGALAGVLEAMGRPEHFGVSRRVVPEFCAASRAGRWPDRLPQHFCVRDAVSPLDLANRLVAPGDAAAPLRRRAAPYLERFARFFEPAFYAERAVLHALGDTARREVLERAFRDGFWPATHGRRGGGGGGGGKPAPASAAAWLYNDEYELDAGRARELLAFLRLMVAAEAGEG